MRQSIHQCFGCLERSMRQNHGTIYNKHETEKAFFDVYQNIGKPDIKCVTCKKEVRYKKDASEQWEEISILPLPF